MFRAGTPRLAARVQVEIQPPIEVEAVLTAEAFDEVDDKPVETPEPLGESEDQDDLDQ